MAVPEENDDNKGKARQTTSSKDISKCVQTKETTL